MKHTSIIIALAATALLAAPSPAQAAQGETDTQYTAHIVARGECLFGIAAEYAVAPAAILRENESIIDPSLLNIGQVLHIPTATENVYQAKKGDTFARIADGLGMGLDELLAANPGVDPNVVDVGEYILLPTIEQTTTDALPMPSTDAAPDDADIADLPLAGDEDAADMAYEVLGLLNAERTANGRPEVTYDETIAALARLKSQNMAENGYLSHTSPQLGSPFKMLRDNGIDYITASENIARGQQSADEVVSAWMASTGHRESMLNPNFQRIGVGYAQDAKGRSYWTIIFIA